MADCSPGLHGRWSESGLADGVSRDVGTSKAPSHQSLLRVTPRLTQASQENYVWNPAGSRGRERGSRRSYSAACARRLNISGCGRQAREPSCVAQAASRRPAPRASIRAASDCSGLRYPEGKRTRMLGGSEARNGGGCLTSDPRLFQECGLGNAVENSKAF